MKYIEIKKDKEIKWPDCCAYCTEKTYSHVDVKYSIISGVNPLLHSYTREIQSVKYPVCKKHYLLGKFYSFFSHQSFVDLFAGLLFIPLLMSLPFIFLPFIPARLNMHIFLFFCASYILSVIVISALQPVKIRVKKDGTTRVLIANNQYAKAFKRINMIG